MKYSVNKIDFGKKYAKYLYVFFENGDYIYIDGSECITVAVTVYDKLVRHNDGFCAVAASGHIELRLNKENAYLDTPCFLHNSQECEKNRKHYIEQRCLLESRITSIRFFDRNHWSYNLTGNFCVNANGEILTIHASPVPHMGDASGKKHTAFVREPRKKDIFRVSLDFENCESFDVFNAEIKKLKLVLDEKLTLGSSVYHRRIKGGYCILQLQKDNQARCCHLFGKKHVKRKDLKHRLYGSKGYSTHDICHLYIEFYHAGYGCSLNECIEVASIKSAKEIERLIQKEERDESIYYAFQSGYAKRLKGGKILLTFGKTAKQTEQDICGNVKRKPNKRVFVDEQE